MEQYDRRIRVVEHREALSDYLQTKLWDIFFTVTFKTQRRDSLAALRDVANYINDSTCARSFIVIEPHRAIGLKAPGVHSHGLLKFDGYEPLDLPFFDIPKVLRSQLENRFGYSTVGWVRSSASVAAYCSKYVTKASDFDYDFFGDWR